MNTAYTGCADVLYDAIRAIQSGTVNVVRQDTIEPAGIYCDMRGSGNGIINWNSSSREIFNFKRSVCGPGSLAISRINGQEIKINRAREVKGAHRYINTPGHILDKTEHGFYVKMIHLSK